VRHGEGISPLAFVYVQERVRHEEMGWTGVITEVDAGRGWIRVLWDRPGNPVFNMDFYTEREFLERFGWDGPKNTWIIRPLK
jgi:hypothetical protein